MLDYGRMVEMAITISSIRQEMDRLRDLGAGVNCVEKNIDRMSACLKMLELDISDAVEVLCDK